MSGRRWLVRAAPFIAALLAAPDARAGTATDELRGFFAEAHRVVGDPRTEAGSAERLGTVQRLVHRIFDFRKAAETSLGQEWALRTPGEQEEFVRLFAALLERAFIWGVAARLAPGGDPRIAYLGEAPEGEGMVVRTTVVGRDGRETPYQYRMVPRGSGWAVMDVVIDGVSVVANYQAQVRHVLQAASYGELVRRMRARVAEAPAMWAAASADQPQPASTPGPAASPPVPLPAPPLASPEAATLPAPAPPGPLVAQEPTPGLVKIAQEGAARAAGPHGAVGPRATTRPVASAEPSSSPSPPRPVRLASARPPASAEPSSPPPAARQARPARARAPADRSYWVQVGAFASPEAVERLLTRLREWRLPVQTEVVVTTAAGRTGVPLSRVRVGPFADRGEAERTQRELRARGFSPFIAAQRD